jgi:hypothetical protein
MLIFSRKPIETLKEKIANIKFHLSEARPLHRYVFDNEIFLTTADILRLTHDHKIVGTAIVTGITIDGRPPKNIREELQRTEPKKTIVTVIDADGLARAKDSLLILESRLRKNKQRQRARDVLSIRTLLNNNP